MLRVVGVRGAFWPVTAAVAVEPPVVVLGRICLLVRVPLTAEYPLPILRRARMPVARSGVPQPEATPAPKTRHANHRRNRLCNCPDGDGCSALETCPRLLKGCGDVSVGLWRGCYWFQHRRFHAKAVMGGRGAGASANRRRCRARILRAWRVRSSSCA